MILYIWMEAKKCLWYGHLGQHLLQDNCLQTVIRLQSILLTHRSKDRISHCIFYTISSIQESVILLALMLCLVKRFLFEQVSYQVVFGLST